MPSTRRNRIDIAIQDAFKEDVPRGWLRGVASGAVKKLGLDEPCQLSLVIADDDTVRCLNRDYRGLDETTDVLSFSTIHQGHWQGDEVPAGLTTGGDADVGFIYPEDEPRPIGEVIISYPQVLRQAKDGDSQRELALLVVHGILHLGGYDHDRPDEEAVMWAKQDDVLSGLRA